MGQWGGITGPPTTRRLTVPPATGALALRRVATEKVVLNVRF
jgi:hypothetical protein